MSLRDFARTIDRLYDDHHAGRVPGKRLLVILGNGTHRIANILNDRDIDVEAKKRGYRPGSKKFREFQWRLFEYARYFTSYGLPTLAHVAIYQLVADGLCRDVVTTNYDLILDAIWAKYPELRVVQNPTLRTGQYDWDRFHSRSSLRGEALTEAELRDVVAEWLDSKTTYDDNKMARKYMVGNGGHYQLARMAAEAQWKKGGGR